MLEAVEIGGPGDVKNEVLGGIGTWLLSYAEQIAARLGRTRVRLTARSLAQDELSDEDLTSWYETKGYVQCAIATATLEKRLSLAPT